ncbi:hypothetical protein K0U00_31305, partial [Paenibacillus sepulcri]|nr:hypothetical protein [Paenibacillus sepulcri]
MIAANPHDAFFQSATLPPMLCSIRIALYRAVLVYPITIRQVPSSSALQHTRGLLHSPNSHIEQFLR